MGGCCDAGSPAPIPDADDLAQYGGAGCLLSLGLQFGMLSEEARRGRLQRQLDQKQQVIDQTQQVIDQSQQVIDQARQQIESNQQFIERNAAMIEQMRRHLKEMNKPAPKTKSHPAVDKA
jgi:TolA-binding protein